MRPLNFAALLCACLPAGYAADADPLAEHRWKHRLLLIATESAVDEDIDRMREALAARTCEIDDRDMVIGWLLTGAGSRLGSAELTTTQATALRSRLRIRPDDAQVVLIGKDGGIKARYDTPPELDEVFALIDGMPMRQAEVEARTARCANNKTPDN